MGISEIIEKYKKAINAIYTKEELQEIISNNPEIEYALINIIPLLNIQPERSKREDIQFVKTKNCAHRNSIKKNFDDTKWICPICQIE